jgi:hypothetical protein
MSTNSSKDRSSLCAFTFADGRHCRMPRKVNHPHLCPFHARKEAQALAGKEAGQDIAYHVSGAFLSACDLSTALGRAFSAVAQGQIKPKTAASLGYLAQSIVQIIPLARHEYIKTYGAQAWLDAIYNSHESSRELIAPEPQSPALPLTAPSNPAPESDANPQYESNSGPSHQPSQQSR